MQGLKILIAGLALGLFLTISVTPVVGPTRSAGDNSGEVSRIKDGLSGNQYDLLAGGYKAFEHHDLPDQSIYELKRR